MGCEGRASSIHPSLHDRRNRYTSNSNLFGANSLQLTKIRCHNSPTGTKRVITLMDAVWIHSSVVHFCSCAVPDKCHSTETNDADDGHLDTDVLSTVVVSTNLLLLENNDHAIPYFSVLALFIDWKKAYRLYFF